MNETELISIQALTATAIYPEREELILSRFDRMGVALAGIIAPWIRPRDSNFEWIVGLVNEQTETMKKLEDDAILPLARSLGQHLRREGYTDELVARTFALIREAAGRIVGMRHFDVQLIGGLVLLKGMVAEMETGEGKTLTATLAAGTSALAGTPVHIVTVNDYLAERDSCWMRPIYEALGLTVGTIKHGLDPDTRRAAYRCDITYCTNKEVAFDYLKDRIVLRGRPGQVQLQLEKLYGETSRAQKLLMRGLHFAIVDEADSVLIDEARTPLIVSAEAGDFTELLVYREAFDIARELTEAEDFKVMPSERSVELTDACRFRIEMFPWQEARGWTTRAQREELVRQALTALYLFSVDKQYIVRDGKVQIVDEYTGRVMADRSWERGLQQLIEIKETCKMTTRKESMARISYQRFFRRYLRLAGMTGTAREVAGELWSIYRVRVVTVPTNRPVRRTYLSECIYLTAKEKWNAIVETVHNMHKAGRPVLVGTRSVETSEHLSGLLQDAGLPHRVLNARQDREEAEIIAHAGEPGCITVATNMAGRGTDILLAPGIADHGGLHVIATELHESGRIDRQLFGRCGRQGDPGTYEVLVSLEDELVTVYAGELPRHMAALLLTNSGRQVSVRIVRGLFLRAQNRADRLHSRIRRDLLRADEQLGDTLAFSGRQE